MQGVVGGEEVRGEGRCESLALPKVRYSFLAPEILGEDDPHVIVHEEVHLAKYNQRH